jgi:hypothetical protein
MPDNEPTSTTTPATPAPAPAAPAAPAAPEWKPDGPFDPDRAASLISNLQGDKQKLQDQRDAQAQELATAQAKIAQFEAAQLSEAERKDKELADTKAALIAAQRTAALVKFGLDESAAVFINGQTETDIESQAQALAALKGTPAPAAPSSAVTPALTPVTAPGTPEPGAKAFNAREVAANARKRRY